MGKMVEVHNLNVHPYKEDFRERQIVIPPKGFIEMEWEEAIMFKGTMNNVEKDADGNVLPTSYKMLKIVQSPEDKKEMEKIRAQAQTSKCQACGYQAVDKQDLHIHIKEEHAHMIEDPKVAKQLLKK